MPDSPPSQGPITLTRTPGGPGLPGPEATAEEIAVGEWYPLGATWDGNGTNFAVFSRTAESVELCLFDNEGNETRYELPEVEAFVWHGYLETVEPGQLYGYRVRGPYDPARGLRANHAKLLLDPYAKAISGELRWGPEVYGYREGDDSLPDDRDSAPFVPKSLVVDTSFEWADDRRPRVSWADTVVYETHVKGLTWRHPEVPPALRGTYSGVAHPAMVEHYQRLGITTLELMPVHHFVDEHQLADRGLRNYWGYNSIGFFAPHQGYAARPGHRVVNEFKAMVRTLHAAGIEVVLDVVYNHTAEGDHTGPTLCFRGLDNPSYYRLDPADPRRYTDTTGTGNTMDVSNPQMLGLLMDSLRYWVTEMHVDGFRFDLATTLTRQSGYEDIHSSFLTLVHQDPVLAPVKMIAEPWDIAGYQLGGFPARWSEWNGKYRDCVRDFWRGADGTLGELALRISGSADIYASDRRVPTASINFVTAHDGFTLADLTAYNDKHNEGNEEDNNDGESYNRSWNCGAEGPTDDPDVLDLRERQRRNLLGTLLLSAGVPMLSGGDEIGRSQLGNNNAYCQDNELSWYDWENIDKDLLAFTKEAIALRRANHALRPREYLGGAEGGPAQMVLYRPDGKQMKAEDWQDPNARALMVALDGRQIEDADGETSSDRFLLLLNAHYEPVRFRIPPGRATWAPVLTTGPVDRSPRTAGRRTVNIAGRSFLLLHSS